MRTRRERLERKIEKRQEWAEKAEAHSAQHFERAHQISDGIPMGQPVLLGHHSEKRHRRDLDRIDSNMRKGVENYQLAQHHTGKAVGLAHQLKTSIFSDDTDAIAALEARIAERTRQLERMKALNAAYRSFVKLDRGSAISRRKNGEGRSMTPEQRELWDQKVSNLKATDEPDFICYWAIPHDVLLAADADLASLTRERDEAQEEANVLAKLAADAVIERDKLRAEARRLKVALDGYGRHDRSCAVVRFGFALDGPMHEECTCGLRQALCQTEAIVMARVGLFGRSEGWAQPPGPSVKKHYFRDQRSLCGQYAFFGELDFSDPTPALRCAWCDHFRRAEEE